MAREVGLFEGINRSFIDGRYFWYVKLDAWWSLKEGRLACGIGVMLLQSKVCYWDFLFSGEGRNMPGLS